MTTPLHPNLATILPKPLLHHLATTEPPYRAAMTTRPEPGNDYLVDVRPPPTPNDADTPGFGLGQATTVAARIARWFQDDAAHSSLHRPDAERSAGLLARVERDERPRSLLASTPAPRSPSTESAASSSTPRP